MNKFNKEEKEFIDYVYEFYGPKGIYPIPTTKKEIGVALNKLKLLSEQSKILTLNANLTLTKKEPINVYFDSIDRERVRDIIKSKGVENDGKE
jgi:hypothetical protein